MFLGRSFFQFEFLELLRPRYWWSKAFFVSTRIGADLPHVVLRTNIWISVAASEGLLLRV